MKLVTLSLLLSLPLAAKGPPNDNFANAIALPDKAVINKEVSLTDRLDRFRATNQDDEPDHAGRKGQGSVWYSWTPKNSRRVELNAANENMDLLLAVYTGETLADLTLVHRYQDFAYPAFSRKRTEPFTQAARVEFHAQAGTTYYFAVDSENPVFETFKLTLSNSINPISPQLELLKPGSQWEFLLATNDNGKPVDPKSLDEDFYHTWMFPKRYDGPPFKEGNAPIGYVEISTLRIKSNLLGKRGAEPPELERYTSYARTTFTPVLDVTAIGIEGIIDDGAIIYLNGREVGRINIAGDQNPQDWQAVAKSARISHRGAQVSVENVVQYLVVEDLNLPADVPVNLCLSLHNNNSKSTDTALDIRVFSLAAKDLR